MRAALLGALAALMASAPARAEGDSGRGERVFQQCFSCHSVEPGEAGLQGPNLRGVAGGPVAARPDFEYSDALRYLAQREPAWTDALLDRYVADPAAAVPGTRMHYVGLKDAGRRADVIAYLKHTK